MSRKEQRNKERGRGKGKKEYNEDAQVTKGRGSRTWGKNYERSKGQKGTRK